jgi:hypothetical protein
VLRGSDFCCLGLYSEPVSSGGETKDIKSRNRAIEWKLLSASDILDSLR